MKNIIKSLLIFLVIFVFYQKSWAACICTDVNGVVECYPACVQYCDTGTGFKSTPRLIYNPGGGYGSTPCTDAVTALQTSELARSEYSGGNCTIVHSEVTDSCSMVVFSICCDEEFITAVKKMEVTVYQHHIYTDVDPGAEADSAKLAFNAFSAAHGYPNPTGSGMVRTDGLEGYAYVSSQAPDGEHVTIDVDMWKRGVYAPTGTTATIESITGGGGSGGGLTQEQLTSGVTSSLNTAGMTAAALKDKMDLAFDRAHALGYMNSVPNWTGFPGITAADYPGLKPLDIAGTYSGGDASGHDTFALNEGESSGWSNFFKDAISTPFSDFKTNMQGTGMYGAVSGFFDPGQLPLGDLPAPVSIVTTYFGTFNFDYTRYASLLNILKAVVLISFGYARVKIVMKGGGG